MGGVVKSHHNTDDIVENVGIFVSNVWICVTYVGWLVRRKRKMQSIYAQGTKQNSRGL